ncbi:MAG TPA: hypothetical protein VFP65_02900 [Anaeromyxobacteraceae bacterium]|nr:hypothetical protein [Anaeromyxobacteraceae bacterium]
MRPLAAALLLLAAAPCPAAAADRFRSDDLAGAVAEASRKDVPIFVEVWVPW